MPNTPEEIRAFVEREVAKYPELDALNSPDNPNSSVWNQAKSLFVFLTYFFQSAWIRFRDEILGRPSRTLSLEWYEDVGRRWQVGHELIVDENGFRYEQISIPNRLVKFIIAREINLDTDPTIEILCAREDPDNPSMPDKLELNNYLAFSRYMNRVRSVGTKLSVYTRDPDRIKFQIIVFVDPLRIKVIENNVSSGELINGTDRPIDDAIRQFFIDLGFERLFHTSALIDAIQEVEGVVAAEIHGNVQHNRASDAFFVPPPDDYEVDDDGNPIFVNMTFNNAAESVAGGELHAGYAVWVPPNYTSYENSQDFGEGSVITYYSSQ